MLYPNITHPAANGHHPISEQGPATLPGLLATIDETRDVLANLLYEVDRLVDATDTAFEFIDRRVEQARVRERRRTRRRRRSS